MCSDKTDDVLKIALPKTKGTHRVGTHLSDLFKDRNVSAFESQPRQDDCLFKYNTTDDVGFRGFHASSSDCADYLMDGVVDASVIGVNRLADRMLEAEQERSLKFDANDVQILPLNMRSTACKVVLAIHEDYNFINYDEMRTDTPNDPRLSLFGGDICPVRDGDLVLTSHFGIASNYFKKMRTNVRLQKLDGSLETAARGLYEGAPIIDITQTGQSLEANGYRVKETLLQSEAMLAWRRDRRWSKSQTTAFDRMLNQLRLDRGQSKALTHYTV